MNALPDIAGRTLTDAVNWIDRELATRCDDAWERQLPALTDLHARIGEPAYGRFVQQLFAPVTARLEEADLRCVPRLPGTLPLSEEWGPEDRRERRMWTLLRDDRADVVLGAVVTRFFHDHTRLRLPARPTVVGLPETDHDRIRESVLAGSTDPFRRRSVTVYDPLRGYPAAVPYVLYRDPDAAAGWLAEVLGYREALRLTLPGGPVVHVELVRGGAVLMLGPEGGRLGRTASITLVFVDDVDDACTRATAAGGAVLDPPVEQAWGLRQAVVADPEGQRWELSEHVRDVDPSRWGARQTAPLPG